MTPRATGPRSSLDPEAISDLVCAMLAVNNLSLERSVELHPALEREGLLDLCRLTAMEIPEIFEALRRAEYPKSEYVTGLVSGWLKAMATRVGADDGRELAGLLDRGPSAELDAYLLSIKGVGSVVLRNFKILRGMVG
ncbi:MAG: hypothetical protein GF330_10495 [Candidatus Eisenbacteria bacterium]|nr:hypothetical protein [Candidatus Eisenbacteria bacterium]